MRLLIALLAALWTVGASAQDYSLMELRRFAMEGYQIRDHDDQYFPYSGDEGEKWAYGTAVLFDFDLVRVGDVRLHFDSKVHGEATTKQFREVGWQYEMAVSFGRRVDVFCYHHSRHLLDAAGTKHFPLDNYVGGRVTFYEKSK